MHCLNMWILREHGLGWMKLNFSRKQSVLTGPSAMWTSCESYIKQWALFVLICCLEPTLCMATFWPPLGLQCQSLHLIYLFYLSFLHILISKFNFQNSNFHIFSFNLYYFRYYDYFIYLFIYLFIFKIPSLNNSSKFWFPNLIPSF